MWLSRLNIKWWRSFQSGRLLMPASDSIRDVFWVEKVAIDAGAGGDPPPAFGLPKPSEVFVRIDISPSTREP
jgi:hypothetical protein